jgi:hypothetical protein
MEKIILSTGDAEKDVELLAQVKGETVVNRNSQEDAKERERLANEATAKHPDEEGASGNLLTAQPRIAGQVLAVVDDGEEKSASEEYVDSVRNSPKRETTVVNRDLTQPKELETFTIK